MSSLSLHKKYDLDKKSAQEEGFYKIKKKVKIDNTKTTALFSKNSYVLPAPILNESKKVNKETIDNKKIKGNENTPLKISDDEDFEEKPAFHYTYRLKNLISKRNTSMQNEEIDLFENEKNIGVDSGRNVDLENYLLFLKNNINDKNIMVIPIEDDEELTKNQTDLWKYPVNNISIINDKFRRSLKNLAQKNILKKSDCDKMVVNRNKWENTYFMEIPFHKESIISRTAKVINLN